MYAKRQRKKSKQKIFLSYISFEPIKNILIYSAIVLSVICLLFNFVGKIGYIEGPSMEPTAHDSQFFISFNQESYHTGDIVVAQSIENKRIIKRIIGIPNDSVEIKDNKVYVNDLQINEYYINPNTEMVDMPKVQLSDNEYFVMGDNRNNSKDSRSYGKLFEHQIKSKVVNIFDIPFITK